MTILLALWRLLRRRHRRQLIGLQVLSVTMALSTVGGIAAVIPFFTVLTDPKVIERNPLLRSMYYRLHFDNQVTFVTALGIAFCAIVLLANTVNYLGSLAINRFAFRIGDTFYVRLFDEYLGRDYGFHLQNNSSILASRVLYETARVASGILQQGLILVTNLVTIMFVVVSIVLLNPLVAIGAVIGLGTSYAVIYLIARGRLLRNGLTESRYYAERAQVVNESFAAIKEITILQVRDFFVRRFTRQCESISRVTLSNLAISQSPRHVLECATVFCLVGVALYLRGRSDGPGPWVAQLSFIGLAAYRLLPALQQAFSAIVTIRANRPAFANIAADLQLRSIPESPRSIPRDRVWLGRPHHELRLHEVWFQYAFDRPAVISRLSLSIPAGAVVGFVGTNGSGKTTLVDLLAGLLIPQSGHVEIDGIVLDHTNRGAWQATIAYVPQHVFLQDATLAENIALGISRERIDRERLDTAVELARLTECVATLPRGYEEVLGERGCRLSGGQRQRLGIARALYRNASLMILDEATSGLDSAAEEEIMDMLEALRPGRTILLIGHRPSALRLCDVIFEFRNGHILLGGPRKTQSGDEVTSDNRFRA
jgi:ABC-type multidrug transport system fused ATPase/permease subunit